MEEKEEDVVEEEGVEEEEQNDEEEGVEVEEEQPGLLNLSTLRTRILSHLGFERSPDTWMSRRRTSRQEMQERRRWARRHFKDLPAIVCCADQLPGRVENRVQSFVVNTDSCDREGTQWVAFHFP